MLTSDPGFVPPHCPHPDCVHHRDATGWRFTAHGTFRRQADPARIRRFRCCSCLRTFSTQTFDATYYLKRPRLQVPLFHALNACAALRQAGRSLGCAASTLQRQASRLGRHCLLFERVHRPQPPPAEPMAMDGLMSFEYSQFWPFEINLLVGTRSHYIYGFTDSELRRSGRMTAEQRAKRRRLEATHGKPDPQATRKAIEKLVPLVAPDGGALQVLSDEHMAYPRAFRRLPHRIQHQTFSSRRCRTRANPLFVIDLLDMLVRHGGSNHKRETIAFSKRRQGALERMAVMQVWRNHVKRTSERRRDSPTPAMTLGLATRPLTPEDVLQRRLFPSHHELPEPVAAYYWRRVPTRQVPTGTRHELRRAC